MGILMFLIMSRQEFPKAMFMGHFTLSFIPVKCGMGFLPISLAYADADAYAYFTAFLTHKVDQMLPLY